MQTNVIINGDTLSVLKTFENESVDCIITSPPYFNLRDYESTGQIGKENNIFDYLENLLDVFYECRRVLKNNGSLWVNIDDVYQEQTLLCIPDRLKIKMVHQGWLLRNEIIWKKPNAMPSSAKTRFNNDYEKFFFFTKSKHYKFNTQYEPMKTVKVKNTHTQTTRSKYKSIEQEKALRQGIDKTRGTHLIEKRNNLPTQEHFVNFIRERTTINQIIESVDIKRSTVEHWFRKDVGGFNYPTVSDWNKVKFLVDDWSEEFRYIDNALTAVTYETDDVLKNCEKGRIKRAVWDINTKPLKDFHFAPFPEELVKTPILACTAENDIVLDIFSGSGTTCKVAKDLKRRYIGIDINKEYCNIARKRIGDL